MLLISTDDMMVLIVDIGNTSINFGVFKKNKKTAGFHIPALRKKGARGYTASIKKELRNKKIPVSSFNGCFIGSVVPGLTPVIRRAAMAVINKKPLVFSRKTKINVRNKYRNKSEVGDDRIANAAAGRKIFPGKNFIVIDFGTAITFDTVNKKGEYLGGIILPGIGLMKEILFKKTARLPDIKVKIPKGIIGRDTRESISIGIVNSAAAGVNYLVRKVKKELKDNNAKVILTGGWKEQWLMDMLDFKPSKTDPDFTLKGFKIIYDINTKNGK